MKKSDIKNVKNLLPFNKTISKLFLFLLVLFFNFSSRSISTQMKEEESISPKITIAPDEEEKRLLSELNANPNNSENLFNLGNHYFIIAVDYDTKYLWGNPKHLNANKEKAVYYSLKAIYYFKKALSNDPKNATLFAKLSEAYGVRIRNGGLGVKMKFMGDFNSNLKKALELDPQNFEALITNAYKTLYTPSLFRNRNKSALTQFDQLLKKYPDNPDVTKGLAIVHTRLGNNDKAFDFISHSLNVNPSDLESIALREEIEKKLSREKKKQGS